MKKKTFWKKLPTEKKTHIRFIISDPDENNNVLVVNMTTFHNNGREDTSCILDIGDHPKIEHKSWLNYAESEELHILKLTEGSIRRIIPFDSNISDEVLKKIQQGARKTSQLAKKFRKYFKHF